MLHLVRLLIIFILNILITFLHNLNKEEANGTEASPSVSIPLFQLSKVSRESLRAGEDHLQQGWRLA
jgi:hypothetical protein